MLSIRECIQLRLWRVALFGLVYSGILFVLLYLYNLPLLFNTFISISVGVSLYFIHCNLLVTHVGKENKQQ
jgi:hypothetical protein